MTGATRVGSLTDDKKDFVEPFTEPTTAGSLTTLGPGHETPPDHTTLVPLAAHVELFSGQGIADSTRLAYDLNWRTFTAWCTEHAVASLPASAETVSFYVTDLALQGRKFSTLTQHLAAISFEHQQAGLATPSRSPAVRHVMTGIRRTIKVAPHQVDALYTEDIRRMVATLPDTLIGLRDRALLLLGFAGAFRRSELVALNVDDLQFRMEGLCVRLRRSKTDQDGQGRLIGIPYGQHEETCPVRAMRAWLDTAQITDGAVFRGMCRHNRIASERLSKRAVADVIKRTAKVAGMDPAHVSGHSLRAGHCTTAARAGVSEHVIMQQTGHRSLATLHRYIRQGSLFLENSAASLGL